MNTTTCIIIDDEPIAREIILNYCSHLSWLQVVASCSTALDAKNILKQQAIDILFLDIQMPVLDGFAFLKTLKNIPQIIFTTAYRKYAADAFELSACDYLVKPFSLERFIVAVDKALERLKPISSPVLTPVADPFESFVIIKTDGKIYRLEHNEILFAEAKGNYTKIITDAKTIMPVLSLSGLEELLPKNIFARVHRSFIINKSKVTHIEGNRVFVQKNEIPIGNNYKEAFLKFMGI